MYLIGWSITNYTVSVSSLVGIYCIRVDVCIIVFILKLVPPSVMDVICDFGIACSYALIVFF